MDGLHVFTLRARSGREQTDLWLLPDAAWLQNFYDKARKRGLTVIENDKELRL